MKTLLQHLSQSHQKVVDNFPLLMSVQQQFCLTQDKIANIAKNVEAAKADNEYLRKSNVAIAY